MPVAGPGAGQVGADYPGKRARAWNLLNVQASSFNLPRGREKKARVEINVSCTGGSEGHNGCCAGLFSGEGRLQKVSARRV
eukprot:1157517-Pelagomonas_calceolata.AAC.4